MKYITPILALILIATSATAAPGRGQQQRYNPQRVQAPQSTQNVQTGHRGQGQRSFRLAGHRGYHRFGFHRRLVRNGHRRWIS